MPVLDFDEFLDRHHLQMLMASTDDIHPGAVVDKARRGYMPQGSLREILTGEPDEFWETEFNEANLIYGTIERTFNLGSKASLAEMGVNIEGGLSKAKSASFAITGIHARSFVNGPGHASMLSLVPKVHELKKVDKARWKLVNGKWIVVETWYATEATITFQTSGNVDLKGEIEKAGGVSVSGSGGVKWTGRRSFVITENNRVPFGFRGWQV